MTLHLYSPHNHVPKHFELEKDRLVAVGNEFDGKLVAVGNKVGCVTWLKIHVVHL